AGWSGSGKTTLITKVIPLLVGSGVRIATVKHAHESLEVDQPGKDSFLHRKAGASEVIVASPRRWVQIHELGDRPEATLPELLRRVSACDLILVEGFKSLQHPKMEVFRRSLGKSPLYPEDSHIVAVASDSALPGAAVPVVDLNDLEAIARIIQRQARPLAEVLGRLSSR